MSATKFHQIVHISDFRYDGDEGFDYPSIAEDADGKTISLLEAIQFISAGVRNLSDDDENESQKIISLADIIFDLSELAIATNKVSQTAAYLSGLKDGKHGA
ncbi:MULTISPECIES: hypothetical protein [Enterobacteriaceae]|uniref:hypothetical protein n=1 Tax=Enterobacteriaceae TaxID=543 RepID=UPI000494DFC3|nr:MULTISPECIES: hypothetical protein [Enterobacteriaceae]ELY4627592.1 hypothetical protein [Cronobacter sakazakii]NHW97003.1 hypothetical protein [Cronobacter sp. HA18006]